MSLDGKVAIVSGAGPNIGRQIAATLAENGARLVCLDVRGEAAQATADALRANGFEALAVQGGHHRSGTGGPRRGPSHRNIRSGGHPGK